MNYIRNFKNTSKNLPLDFSKPPFIMFSQGENKNASISLNQDRNRYQTY